MYVYVCVHVLFQLWNMSKNMEIEAMYNRLSNTKFYLQI